MMATSSLIFLIQLIFVTSGNVLILAAPVDDFCGKTIEPPRCVALLESTDIRTRTAAGVVLEGIAIEAANYSASMGNVPVQELIATEKDPNVRNIYGICENCYLNAIFELYYGQQNLKRRRYPKLVRTGEIVFNVAGCCAPAIQKNPSLKRTVADTGVLGQLLGIIARAL